MKNNLLLLLLLSLASAVSAQELLVPATTALPASGTKSNDTIVMELPFFDDFSDCTGSPSPIRWMAGQAFVNTGFAPQPPTIGMATLDALDANGSLYPHASTNLFAADTLASQILRLDSITGINRRLQSSDSIVLSFFFVPGGWYGNAWELVGDAPSTQDSLFLDFYDADSNRWNVVWSVGGFNADTAGRHSHWPWHFAAVKIDDTRYLTNGFRFRFRNYASLDANPLSGIAANCDQWNIDYIFIDRNRSVGDSIFRDVAFVEQAPSMLKEYQAMPARQYRTADMAAHVEISIVNRYNQTLSSTYRYSVSTDGNTIASYNGGYENIPAFFPDGKYQTSSLHSNPAVNFAFPENNMPTSYRITHFVREGVGGDNRSCNDTMVFTQHLDNYYAYDDGTAENGYGLTVTGNKQWLACRHVMRVPDTLTAVDIYFNRCRNDENAETQFQLCVWQGQDNLPATLLHKENARQTPQFDGLNSFHRYVLETPVVISDTVFVGFEQLSSSFINIGFDRNTDSRNATCYRTGNEWSHSFLRGSLMMRPVFGSKATAGITCPTDNIFTINLYPNPASGIIHLSLHDNGDPSAYTLSLFDTQGRLLWSQRWQDSIDISHLPKGVYMLQVHDSANGSRTTKKIIKH